MERTLSEIAEIRGEHARAGTPIPYPEHPSPKDVLAKHYSNGLNLWTDWYSDADETIKVLSDAGYQITPTTPARDGSSG